MEGSEPPHEVALTLLEAVALVHDGVDGAAVVVAGREDGDGERPLCIIETVIRKSTKSNSVEYVRQNIRPFTA